SRPPPPTRPHKGEGSRLRPWRSFGSHSTRRAVVMVAKLATSGLSKSFGDLQVLLGIDLAVARGEFISLVGPSGCGKTTFLRIVAGLEPASSGQVTLDGRVVNAPGGDRGFVFQSDSLLPWRSVFAN